MRYLIIVLLSVLSIQFSHSQINEIGIFVGGSNFIGDVGATNYIAPNQFAFGGIYKWNRSKRHSYRLSLLISDLKGVDAKSDDPRRQQRGLEFTTSITEISAGVEFNFLDFDLHKKHRVATPYMFTGITAANHKDFFFVSGEQRNDNTYSWALGIPMGLGFKASLTNRFVLAAEIGARYTFSDGLDGSLPADSSNSQFRFGNINNNDWYVFSGITLTYTFGERPCYCPPE